MSTTTIEFPQELIDKIIDLVFDKRALKACSVAFHAFLSRTRLHLFRAIHISTLTEFNFRKKIDMAGLSASKEVCSCVCYLMIDGMGDDMKYLIDSVPRCTFPNLSHLMIFDLPFDRHPMMLFPKETAKNVKDLNIRNSIFGSPRLLLDFTSLFTSLESITLKRIDASPLSGQPQSGRSTAYPRPPTSLKYIDICANWKSTSRRTESEYEPTSDFLKWLCHPSVNMQVASVRAESLDPESLVYFAHFLCIRGEHVKELTFTQYSNNIYSSEKPRDGRTANNMMRYFFGHGKCSPKLTTLHSLHLPLLVIGDDEEIATKEINGRCFELIHRLISPSLNTQDDEHPCVSIRMDVRINGEDGLGQVDSCEFDWDQLARFTSGLESRKKGIEMKIVLDTDDFEESRSDASYEKWKQETMKYVKGKFSDFGVDDAVMSLCLEWRSGC